MGRTDIEFRFHCNKKKQELELSSNNKHGFSILLFYKVLGFYFIWMKSYNTHRKTMDTTYSAGIQLSCNSTLDWKELYFGGVKLRFKIIWSLLLLLALLCNIVCLILFSNWIFFFFHICFFFVSSVFNLAGTKCTHIGGKI